jgi:hypothetical protein
MGSWAHGFMGTWVHGHMGTWVHGDGFMGTWGDERPSSSDSSNLQCPYAPMSLCPMRQCASAPVRPEKLRHLRELQLIQPVIDAPPGEKFLVRAGLADHALVEDHDRIHVLNRRQPVSDGDGRPPFHEHV